VCRKKVKEDRVREREERVEEWKLATQQRSHLKTGNGKALRQAGGEGGTGFATVGQTVTVMGKTTQENN